MKAKAEIKTVYFLYNSMYINVTNLCTNNCVFCIRDLNSQVGGVNLWLDNKEVPAQQIIKEIVEGSPETRDEIVFCGYGEPLIRLEVVKEVAKFIKQNYPKVPVRINTNGHASLIHKRSVVPELVGLIDRVSVSLNADTPELYQELTCCNFDKDLAFENVKIFIVECQKYGIDTTATVVVGYGDYKINIEKCKEIADSLGVKFKIREWLSQGYN